MRVPAATVAVVLLSLAATLVAHPSSASGAEALVAEAVAAVFGLLTGVGLASQAPSLPPLAPEATLLALSAILVGAAFVAAFVGGALSTRRAPTRTGAERLPGTQVIAARPFSPEGERYQGPVKMRGEYWSAVSGEPVEAGDVLTIRERDGLLLAVGPRVAVPGDKPCPQHQRSPSAPQSSPSTF